MRFSLFGDRRLKQVCFCILEFWLHCEKELYFLLKWHENFFCKGPGTMRRTEKRERKEQEIEEQDQVGNRWRRDGKREIWRGRKRWREIQNELDRNRMTEREIDRWGQRRMRKEERGMGETERKWKKPNRQDPISSWARQGAGKKEFEARGTYSEPWVESNCKQTLPAPFRWVMDFWHVT